MTGIKGTNLHNERMISPTVLLVGHVLMKHCIYHGHRLLYIDRIVPSQESQGVITFPGDVVDMGTPCDLAVDGDAQIFSLVCGS